MTPEDEARKLLDELGITELPVIPKDICQRLNISYHENPLKSIDGLLLVDPRRGQALIGVNAFIAEQGRKNFTGAHELGHLCLDAYSQYEFYCSRETIESFNRKIQPIELRANRFAAELLMPRFIYQKLVEARDPGWDQIKELAAISQTSLTSTAIRFIDLTGQACVLIVSQGDMISWFHKSDEFRPYIQMEDRFVLPNTIAYTAFQGSKSPNCFECIKADNWLSGRGIQPDTEILEWTLPRNSYGQVLTLLFDEEGIEGWDEDEYGDDYDDVEWEPPTFHKSRRKE
jgi:hypothetical protein